MKIYLATPPKKYYKLNPKILFSYFMILFPDQKWGAKSDFKTIKNLNYEN
jgi:hypothetical protein